MRNVPRVLSYLLESLSTLCSVSSIALEEWRKSYVVSQVSCSPNHYSVCLLSILSSSSSFGCHLCWVLFGPQCPQLPLLLLLPLTTAQVNACWNRVLTAAYKAAPWNGPSLTTFPMHSGYEHGLMVSECLYPKPSSLANLLSIKLWGLSRTLSPIYVFFTLNVKQEKQYPVHRNTVKV